MHERQRGLHRDIHIHDPGGAVNIHLLHGAAVLIGTENACRAEEQDARNIRYKNAGKYNRKKDPRRYQTLLQAPASFRLTESKHI